MEFVPVEDVRTQFEVNVIGQLAVTQAFIGALRAGRGRIVNVGSISGLLATPITGPYVASKFALEGLSEGLYYELKALNIQLHLIEQGGSEENNFVNNIAWTTSDEIRHYDELLAKVQHVFATAGPESKSQPQEIVDVIYGLASGKNRQFRNPVGNATKMLLKLRESLPIEEYLEKIAANFV